MPKYEKPLSIPLLFVGLLCLTLLSGCGDSNMFESFADDKTTDAQVSTALDAINNADYNTAITILEGLDATDPEVKKYLASAYIGSTGFDTLELIETMGNDAEGTADYSDGGIFTTVNELIGFQDGVVDMTVLMDKIETAEKAVQLLVPDISQLNTFTDEEVFQAGLYSAVQTIYVVENILQGQNPTNTNTDLSLPAEPMSDQAIIDLVVANFDPTTSATPTEAQLNAQRIMDSLEIVVEASATLIDNLTTDVTQSNDVKDGLDEFLVDVGYCSVDPATGMGAINCGTTLSVTDIQNYIIGQK